MSLFNAVSKNFTRFWDFDCDDKTIHVFIDNCLIDYLFRLLNPKPIHSDANAEIEVYQKLYKSGLPAMASRKVL